MSKKTIAVCPNNPEHKAFTTIAHVTEEWLVDQDGNFIMSHGCLETVHGPDRDNIWSCSRCGAPATFKAQAQPEAEPSPEPASCED